MINYNTYINENKTIFKSDLKIGDYCIVDFKHTSSNENIYCIGKIIDFDAWSSLGFTVEADGNKWELFASHLKAYGTKKEMETIMKAEEFNL